MTTIETYHRYKENEKEFVETKHIALENYKYVCLQRDRNYSLENIATVKRRQNSLLSSVFSLTCIAMAIVSINVLLSSMLLVASFSAVSAWSHRRLCGPDLVHALSLVCGERGYFGGSRLVERDGKPD